MAFLRSTIFRALLFVSSPIIALAFLPVLVFDKKGAFKLAKFWTRVVLAELKLSCGVSHHIENPENMPMGGAIVAANHQSMWETVALYALLPNPVFILKEELTKIPVFGWLIVPAGNIVINREGGAKALRALARDAKAAIDAGCQVIIFPEGSRIRPGQTEKYQPGVAGVYGGAKTPCYPVAHNSGEFWRYPGFKKLPGVITVRFLKPIEPGLDRRHFMAVLEEAINGARPDLRANRETSSKTDLAAAPTSKAEAPNGA